MQLTINRFKLLLFLCKKYYKLLFSILISLTIITAKAITDTSIDGIITEIYDDSTFYSIDATKKSIYLGMIPKLTTPQRGTIYATETNNNDPSAVLLKVVKDTTIDSLIIGGTIDSTHSRNNRNMRQSGLIIAASNETNAELTVNTGITIQKQGAVLSSEYPGVKGGGSCIKIKQPISGIIQNYGILDSKFTIQSDNIQCSAISILGASNLFNGGIFNMGIIKSEGYAILSVLYNKSNKSNRRFDFINDANAIVIGDIKLCGDNCAITNSGYMGQESGEFNGTKTKLILEFATVTIENIHILSLVSIESDSSYSSLINKGSLIVVNNAEISKLHNEPGAKAKISGKLDLTEESTNSGEMQIKSLTTAATLTNYNSIVVNNLDNCIINNQATLTVLKSIKNNVSILGALILKDTIEHKGTSKVTSVIGATATLNNTGDISITNDISVAQIVNMNKFTAGSIAFPHFTKNTYNFINDLAVAATINHIKNIKIKSDSDFLVLNTIEGTVEVEGSLRVGTTHIKANSNLTAIQLNGKNLYNKGNVYIDTNSNLDSLENSINCVFVSKNSLKLTKKSENHGSINIDNLTTAINKGDELVNYISGEIICKSLYNAKILNQGGKLQITNSISGKVSIIGGKLLLKDNITNIANLFINSKIIGASFLTNRGSITIIQPINLKKLENSNHLKIDGTLTIVENSNNTGDLIVNVLLDSAVIKNHNYGKIIINDIKNSSIENKSDNPEGLLIKNSIKGDVKILGSLKSIGKLTQEGSLDVGEIAGIFLQSNGKIQAKSLNIDSLINNNTGEITLTNKLFITSATNLGTITTYEFINTGILNNKGRLNIGHTECIVEEGSLINTGIVSSQGVFIVNGTLTNDGALELAELKGIKTYNRIKGQNSNAKVSISKAIIGNFTINQDVELTADATITGTAPILLKTTAEIVDDTFDNFIIKSLSGKFKLTISPENRVKILENAHIGSLNNYGTTIINQDLFLYSQKESTNTGYLSAETFYSNAKLTNTESAIAQFKTIKQAIIDAKAKNSRIEVSNTLDSGTGKTHIYGTLYFTGDIKQSGSLQVEEIQGENNLLTVSRLGKITANTIILKAINNRGHVHTRNALFINNQSTNKGTIRTKKLNCSAILYNTGTLTCDTICKAEEINGGTVIVNKNIIGDAIINSCVYINNTLKLEDNINLIVSQLAGNNNNNTNFIIGKHATANIKQMLADDKLNIINHGVIRIKGGSTIQSYLGESESQLYLTVPMRKLTKSDTLLRIKDSFKSNTRTNMPSIIISADTPPVESLLDTPFNFTVLSTAKLQLSESIDNVLAIEKVKSSSMLLYIYNPQIIEDEENIKLEVHGIWLDVAKINSIKESPVSLRKTADILQKFTAYQCKNAALSVLDYYIAEKKLRPESKKILAYLLDDHSSDVEIATHLQDIQNVFFKNTSTFNKDPVKLLRNLAEYENYKKYFPNKPLTPLLPENIYDLIEQVLVDNSDIIDIANSENLSDFFTSISNRLATQDKNKINNKNQKTEILYNKDNTYVWSGFINKKTKDKAIAGYMINNHTVNLINFGVDRTFNNLQLGWMFGYANTAVKNLGTRTKHSKRNYTYNFKTNTSAIYANYKFDVTSINLALIFGQGLQKEKHIILQEEFNSSFTSNLIAAMGKFIYTNNIDKFFFDISSRFELHYIETPQHSLNSKILVTKPTIRADIKQRTISHRINLGYEFSLYYTIKSFEQLYTRFLLSICYMRNFNLRKDRLQDIEFFKGLFTIEQNNYSINNIYIDFLVQMNIQQRLNINMGVIFSHKDYSNSLGLTCSLKYNF